MLNVGDNESYDNSGEVAEEGADARRARIRAEFKFIERACEDPNVSSPAFRVLVRLWLYRNEKSGLICPSQETLGRKAGGFKERAVRGFTALLSRLQYIVIKPGNGRGETSRYRLLTEARTSALPISAAADEGGAAVPGLHTKGGTAAPGSTSERRHSRVGKAAQPRRKGGTAVPTEQPKEPPTEPQKKSARADARDSHPVVAVVSDVKKAAFDAGVVFLMGCGKTEAQARSLIGKWCRDYGDESAWRAIVEAQRYAPPDPVPYITEVLKRNHTKGQTAHEHRTGTNKTANTLDALGRDYARHSSA